MGEMCPTTAPAAPASRVCSEGAGSTTRRHSRPNFLPKEGWRVATAWFGGKGGSCANRA